MDLLANYWNRYKGFILGRTALSVAVWAVASALSVSALVPALIAVGTGAVFGIAGRLMHQRYYQDEMVDLYRDDIAQSLGIAPAQVTRADLKTAALGNDVLAQALERQHKKTVVSIGTTLLSATVSAALLYFFVDAGQLHNWAQNHIGPTFGPLANLIGLGTVSGLCGLVLHHGLSAAIDYKSGTYKAAAHDRIVGIKRGLEHGRAASAEQVYAVLVAGDAALGQRISQQFGHSYEHLAPLQQKQALQKIGVTDAMQALAAEINAGTLSPGHLAYMIGDDSARAKPATAPEPTTTRGNFVERLGLAPRPEFSHAARLETQRLAAAEHSV